MRRAWRSTCVARVVIGRPRAGPVRPRRRRVPTAHAPRHDAWQLHRHAPNYAWQLFKATNASRCPIRPPRLALTATPPCWPAGIVGRWRRGTQLFHTADPGRIPAGRRRWRCLGREHRLDRGDVTSSRRPSWTARVHRAHILPRPLPSRRRRCRAHARAQALGDASSSTADRRRPRRGLVAHGREVLGLTLSRNSRNFSTSSLLVAGDQDRRLAEHLLRRRRSGRTSGPPARSRPRAARRSRSARRRCCSWIVAKKVPSGAP